jgi:hypothetical protein
MKHAHLLRQATIAMIIGWLAAPCQAEVAFQYLSNPEAKRAADKIAAALLDARAIAPPSGPAAGEPLGMDGPTPGMKRFNAAHKDKLEQLDRTAIIGHPGALLMKCYMGTEARAPLWVAAEGVAWCSILVDEAPASMRETREAARRALEDYAKNNAGASTKPDAHMLATVHQRLAQPEQQGPIQSVDPVVVAKPGMPPEKLVGLVLYQFGRDFTDYINGHDLDRAIFNQQFSVGPGSVIKLEEYAKFALANNFDKTLARHPQLGQQAP